MLMAHQAEVDKALERHSRSFQAEGADRHVSAKGLEDFEVQEVRHVK